MVALFVKMGFSKITMKISLQQIMVSIGAATQITHKKALERFTKLSASHEDPGSPRSSSRKRGSTTGMDHFFIVSLKNNI